MSQEVLVCSIINCPNSVRNNGDSTVFYFVPKDILKVGIWAEALEGRIDNVTPTTTKIVLCKNHFTRDAFEPHSKRLKTDGIPTIFSSSSRERELTTRITKVNQSSNSPSKKLKITNPLGRTNTKETYHTGITDMLSQEYTIQNINIIANDDDSHNDSHTYTISEMQGKFNLSSGNGLLAPPTCNPGPSRGTKLSTASNQLTYFSQKQPIQSPLVHILEKTKSHYLSTASVSKVTKAEQSENESFQTNMVLKPTPTTAGMDEDYDIKEEILDIKADDNSDVKSTGVHAVTKGHSSNKNGYLGRVEDLNRIEVHTENLRIIKQSLQEEQESLQKKERDVDLELKQLRKEIQSRKALSQQLSELEMELLKKCFSPAQIRRLSSQRKNRWSLDDLAIAYTISSLSSRDFYNYLRNTLKYPLPAVSNINRCFKSKYRTKNEGNRQE